MKRAKIMWIVVLLLIVTLLIGLGFTLLSEWESKNKAPFSAENANPTGIKALFKLYQTRGYPTKLWTQDYRDLPETTQDLLIIANPGIEVPDQQKYQALRRWIATGNTIVLFAPVESAWAKRFQFQGIPCMNSLQKQVTSLTNDTWLQKIKQLYWTSGNCVLPKDDQENILVDHQFSSLMVKKQVGKGQIYYIPEVIMMMNSRIAQLDHLYLLIAIAEGTQGVIWFDESVHPWPPPLKPETKTSSNQPLTDKPQTPTIFHLLQFDLWLIVIQIFLLVVLFLHAKGKRFAAAQIEWKIKKRNSMEFIEAMAKWYHRAHLRREVLAEYQQALTAELQQTFRLSMEYTSPELKVVIEQYLGQAYLERYERWVYLPEQRKQKQKIPFAMFRQSVVEIQQLRKELHEWKIKIPNTNKR